MNFMPIDQYVSSRLRLWIDRLGSLISSPDLTPRQITIIYASMGFGALYFSDVYLPRIISDSNLLIRNQAIKGALEIVLTAGLIFVLTSRSRRKLRDKNNRLEQLQAERSVLYRVFQHNLRQDLNLIQGYSELIQSSAGGTSHQKEFRIIGEATNRIGRYIKSVLKLEKLLESNRKLEKIDLVSTITGDEKIMAAMESENVDLTISVPDRIRVWAHPHLKKAFHEVLENAIKHSDQEVANVKVAVERSSTGIVKLSVTDDGPHIPTNEIIALEQMEEQPLTHSDGIGLWYAKLVTTIAGGDLSIRNLEGRGNKVSILLHQ